MDSMYFGDEDPMLVASDRNSLPEVANNAIPSHDEVVQQDQVLLFDDMSSSFSYSDGGGAADISSSVILSPTNPPRDMVCIHSATSSSFLHSLVSVVIIIPSYRDRHQRLLNLKVPLFT